MTRSSSFLCLALCAVTLGCGIRPVVSMYRAETAKQAVRAWSDAYNADQIRQLELLVHPARRDLFDDDRNTLSNRLKTWRLTRFEVGAPTTVKRNLKGHLVNLVYHDGRRANTVEGIVVEARGRWWVWRY